MDRDRLREWLRIPHRTWRWRLSGGYERYDAVSSTDDGLLWYAWSHEHGDDGMQATTLQSYAAFEGEGPPMTVPDAVEGQVRDWVATFRRDGS